MSVLSRHGVVKAFRVKVVSGFRHVYPVPKVAETQQISNSKGCKMQLTVSSIETRKSVEVLFVGFACLIPIN